ncbi:MAG: Lipoate-protein ligase LplJ [Bacteroidetes bacterium ADurb.Bin037]|nr:MAG: Lipoate-protein ligase LplJ [Bacteroidetes bacterium ADurb.Bin037]HPW77866.1 lipoate--protein ligase [Bacteroidales bacterium]HQB55693.1 lipoate--protein ligase [Bacteroidales bacterium]
MRCIMDTTLDPWWNLAVEEYLLTHLREPVFRLWRNSPAVIVGRNQNTRAEINSEFVREHNIAVVRRLSGGGAVFHDLGNINYTFVDRYVPGTNTARAFARFTRPILDVLNGLEVRAQLEGRNDLVIEGRKFSGNAIALHRDRILMHGTLLFNSSMKDLSQALQVKVREEGRGVASNPRRVCNLSEYLPAEMSARDFLSLLKTHIAGDIDTIYRNIPLNPKECDVIKDLCEKKYRTFAWNYGRKPAMEIVKRERFPGGNMEVHLNVKDDIIEDVKIYGDYFFLSPTGDIENALRGCDRTRDAVKERLKGFALEDYFRNIPGERFLDLFF